MSLNVLSIGGSRNIGYFSAIRLLDAGARVTFLLRSLAIFDGDENIQKHVRDDRVCLVKWDGLVKEDVQRAWDEAGKAGPVDVLLFSVGGDPKFSFTKGFYITPANLVTQCLLNALCTLPANQPSQPRIVVITSVGITASSHAALPFPLKLLFGILLPVPHMDKVGAERVIAHVSGWTWDEANAAEPGEEVMGSDWRNREGLPPAGSLKRFLVVRPSFLTNGECIADNEEYKTGSAKVPYRASEEDFYAWTISRKDAAHFIAQAILSKWDEFNNKIISLGY